LTEYRVEFNVELWDYVLQIDGETIPLNQSNVRDAHWYAKMIVEGRKNRNDSSTSNSNPTHN